MDQTGAMITTDPLPTVRADAPLVLEVFQNLISNALKYHRLDEPPRVHISAVVAKDMYVFSVKDNGLGFDMSFAEAIFAPFRRLHTNAEYEGSGIGLATVRRIIECHGGRVWAESEPGKGAEFFFTLPVNGRNR